MDSIGQKSFSMKDIRVAWNAAVEAFYNHDQKTRSPEMGEFFMTELNKLGRDMSDIITYMYCEYEEISKQNRFLGNDMAMFNAKTRVLENTIEDLESSVTTARYYIYLSGMCGFLLGLACLFLVV